MKRATKSLVSFLNKEEGVTAIECALMLALVVVICIVAINIVKPAPAADPTVVAVEAIPQ